ILASTCSRSGACPRRKHRAASSISRSDHEATMTRATPVRYEICLRTVLGPALQTFLDPCGRWAAIHRHTITRFQLPQEWELDDLCDALLAHNVEVVSVRQVAVAECRRKSAVSR